MKPFKVRVTPEQSAAVQLALFSHGARWGSCCKVISFTGYPHLFVSREDYLSLGNDEAYFLAHEYDEVSVEWVLKTFGMQSEEEDEQQNYRVVLHTQHGVFKGNIF